VLEEILQASKASQLDEMDLAFNGIAEEWSMRNGIQIHLHPEAARLLSQKAMESGNKLEDVFSEIFKDYEHGLNLIRRTQGIQQFEITPEVIRDPGQLSTSGYERITSTVSDGGQWLELIT